MKLSEIQKHWDKDSKIDKIDLGEESLKIPPLHSKYYRFFTFEYRKLKKLENDMKVLRREKWEYYSGKSPAQVYKDKPFDLKVLKTDIPMYIESDPDIVNLQNLIDLQETKVLTLKNIIATINNRNWVIRNAIEWQKFTRGDI